MPTEAEKHVIILNELAKPEYLGLSPEDVADFMRDTADVEVDRIRHNEDGTKTPFKEIITRSTSLGFRVLAGDVYRALDKPTGNDLESLNKAISRAESEGIRSVELTAAKTLDQATATMGQVQKAYIELDRSFNDPIIERTKDGFQARGKTQEEKDAEGVVRRG